MEGNKSYDIFKNDEEATRINNIRTGGKFFKYIDGIDEPFILRVKSVDETKRTVKCIFPDKHVESVSADEFLRDYKFLRPDAIFSACSLSVQGENDVMLVLGKPNDSNENMVVCRQGVFDFFSNNVRKHETDDFYVGVSVSKKTCPANINFTDIMACDKLEHNRFMYVYLDDTLDDILSLFTQKKYDSILANMAAKRTFINGHRTVGYCHTLRELLTTNNFMYDFRQMFDIMDLPFAINEETEGLSVDNIIFMENELKVNIMETYLIRYTREIDLRTIKRSYKLVASAADNFSKIYIVGYDVADGDYVPRTSM